MTLDPLAAELSRQLGPSQVLTDPELTAPYETDWTRRWQGRARLVARPGDTVEVAAVLKAAGRAGAGVIPQGGNTGLVGGGVPRGGEVVLSLSRLSEVEAVDADAAQVTVGAGAPLERIQRAAEEAGFDVPVDLASRSQATAGGMAATNAGGVHVLRRGSMRRNVAGMEMVLADGTVISRLSGLAKDNTGYDLGGLVVGSEGTLAVITKVVLGLVPVLPHRVTALLGISAPGDRGRATRAVLDVFGRLRRLTSLEAFELVFPEGVELVMEHTGMAAPSSGKEDAYVVVECGGNDDPTGELAAAVAGCPEVASSAVAGDKAGREALWAYRERHTESIAARGIPHKVDVDIPLRRLPDFVGTVGDRVEDLCRGARTFLFGHVGDGNIHVNVVGPSPDDSTVDDAVMELALEHSGSISAEHGIGVAKAHWLTRARSSAEIDAMVRLKEALDPGRLLNPGALLPPEVLNRRPPGGPLPSSPGAASASSACRSRPSARS